MKKLRALVITVPLFLLITEGQTRALPLSGMMGSQYESRPSEEEPAPPATNKAGKASGGEKKASGGEKNVAVARKHRHGRPHSRRKAKRYSEAARARERFDDINSDYKRRTRTHLVVTSFGRTEAEQARAMRGLIKRHGVEYVRNLYRNKIAVDEILDAYLDNRHDPQQAQREMTRVISEQVSRNVFISKHLRGLAVDIRRHGKGAARLSALRAAARRAGATVLVEPECYHLNLV